MYLRPKRKTVNGEMYEYWSLVKSVRTERGPRQRVVAHIGKEPGLDRQTRVGWEHISEILDGRAHQADFLEGPDPDPPQWAEVDVSRLRVERLRQFGAPYLALALWRRLGLDEFFGDEIDSLRYFDIETQRSSGDVDDVEIPPASEVLLTREWVERALPAIRTAFRRELRHFHECIVDGVPCRTPIESAREDLLLARETLVDRAERHLARPGSAGQR